MQEGSTSSQPSGSSTPGAPSLTHRWHRVPWCLALISGSVLSAVLFWQVRSAEQRTMETEFRRWAELPKAALQRDLGDHFDLLEFIQAFYFSSQEVERGEFRQFTRLTVDGSAGGSTRWKGVRALEWILKVAETNRAAHVAATRTSGFPSYEITEPGSQSRRQRAGQRSEYFPIYFAVPTNEEANRLGLDLAAYPAYARAMKATCASDKPAAVRMQAEDRSAPEPMLWRIFLGIYTNGAPHRNAAQREANLAGYVSEILSLREMVEGSLNSIRAYERGNVALQIHDAAAGGEVLYRSANWPTTSERPEKLRMDFPPIAGQPWQVVCRPSKAFLASRWSMQSWVVLASGLGLTGLLAAYLYNASGRAAQVERMVLERTAELARANQKLTGEIREREQAEHKLARERFLVDTLMETITDHIYFKDVQSRFIRINKAQANIFKLQDPTEAIGKSDFDFFALEHAQRAFDDEQEIIRTGEPMIGREEKETWPDGSVSWVSTTKQALRDKQGHIIGTFGISRDITAHKVAEQALAQKTEELIRSNQELEQFAYVASHDLQEPLRMIASYTQLLARRYQNKLDQEADEFITYAVDGALRMQTLINDLLTYSRVGTRGKPFAPTDCSVVLKRALENLKITIEDNHATIHAGPLPIVMADDVQLTQLFQNLISNAIKFRRDSPPEIYLSAEMQSSPAAANEAPGKEWIFAVRDNGLGIEPEYFERIFVIFQRLHGRDQYPGTGIGLAICKKIVERHGGRIWVASELDQGSTFYFALPQREEFSI